MKKIKWANIDFISLCPQGKNGLKVLYKEDGHFEAQVAIKKATEFEKNGEIIAAIYLPNQVDLDDHFVEDAEAIRSMAYSHARNGGQLDLRHNEKPLSKEQAYVAESFIIQKGDPRFDGLTDDKGNKVDATGGWGAVIKLEDPELKANYEFEGWEGVSLFGLAEVENVKSDEKRVLDRLLVTNKENRMDEKEVLALIAKALEPFSEKLDKLTEIKKAPAADPKLEEKKLQKPVFKGDPTSKSDVLVYQQELKKFRLMSEIDWEDPQAVEKVLADLEKEDKKDNEDGDELARAKAEVLRLEKASKQDPGDHRNDDEPEDENARLFKLGKEAGASVNGQSDKASK